MFLTCTNCYSVFKRDILDLTPPQPPPPTVLLLYVAAWLGWESTQHSCYDWILITEENRTDSNLSALFSLFIRKVIEVKIIDDEEYEKNKAFTIELGEPVLLEIGQKHGESNCVMRLRLFVCCFLKREQGRAWQNEKWRRT